jgi:hypothetical protein
VYWPPGFDLYPSVLTGTPAELKTKCDFLKAKYGLVDVEEKAP